MEWRICLKHYYSHSPRLVLDWSDHELISMSKEATPQFSKATRKSGPWTAGLSLLPQQESVSFRLLLGCHEISPAFGIRYAPITGRKRHQQQPADWDSILTSETSVVCAYSHRVIKSGTWWSVCFSAADRCGRSQSPHLEICG